jgi:hypothetical protein
VSDETTKDRLPAEDPEPTVRCVYVNDKESDRWIARRDDEENVDRA